MTEPTEIELALRKLETKHRVEDYLKKIGATDDAASLLSTHPDTLKLFVWDGVNLHFGKSDLAAVDDDAAKTHFLTGPFGRLFVPADDGKEDGGNDHTQLDPALVESARSGNITAKGKLLRSLNGNVEALDAAISGKRDGDVDAPNGHDKNSANPFLKLRDKRTGQIVPAVQEQINGMIRAMGSKKVAAIAAAAGMTISGTPMRK